jgi:hypothetical protein
MRFEGNRGVRGESPSVVFGQNWIFLCSSNKNEFSPKHFSWFLTHPNPVTADLFGTSQKKSISYTPNIMSKQNRFVD